LVVSRFSCGTTSEDDQHGRHHDAHSRGRQHRRPHHLA